ncbi:uncharacterized protein [Argopecten irradians]|uniref:uncharacterized protein n=1 Tax=Argopecten irradians TaxID=31199 RepID=UPI0037175692
MRSFELYATGKGVDNAVQKQALLLHCAGPAVQDIFYTLDVRAPGEGENMYTVTKTKDVLRHFRPQVNETFERSQFRAMSQDPAESIEQFITRLREKGQFCNFIDMNEMIRDQIIEKCSSSRLRRKLLERRNVTLDHIRELANAFEAAQREATSMETHETVRKVSAKDTEKKRQRSGYQSKKSEDSRTCFACGYSGHLKSDPSCPAKTSVKSIDAGDDDSYINLELGGVKAKFVIDSGAGVNVLDQQDWNQLKRNNIKVRDQKIKPSKRLFAYGIDVLLTVVGSFVAEVKEPESGVQRALLLRKKERR